MLHVALEEVAPVSRKSAIFTILSSPFGSATMRFVGLVDGERRYTGPTFLSPRAVPAMSPREAWAPGLNAALEGLRREIEEHGWEYLGQGEEPWDLYYRRPRWE